jgi:hypothetical protein
VDLEQLEKQSLIERGTFGPKQVLANLKGARRDLVIAKANLEIDEAWALRLSIMPCSGPAGH